MKRLSEIIQEVLSTTPGIAKVTPITLGESGRDGLLVETTDDPPRLFTVLVREMRKDHTNQGGIQDGATGGE